MRAFIKRQWARIPMWVGNSLSIAALLYLLVSNWLQGNAGWCAISGVLLGLHIEQWANGKIVASLSRTCDEWDRMFSELSEHSREQHKALMETLDLLEPAARIVAENERRKH
jgi:hypothetical protein